MTVINGPSLWQHRLPKPDANSHKYARGYSLIAGGPAASTGAARLAALAALRVGSGLVSVACDSESLPIYAATLLAVMTKRADTERELETLLEDERITAVLVGPGCGVSNKTHAQALQALSHRKPCVIDADALSAFAPNPKILFNAIHGPAVLTPHEGEFARLFPHQGSREERALAAARDSNACVLLKGHHTVIATPDGKLAVNTNAPASLATAGSGDVLAGMITGLLAQGVPAYEAACAAAWMHGRAAELFGAGLIAEDLPGLIPAVLKETAA